MFVMQRNRWDQFTVVLYTGMTYMWEYTFT